MESLLISAYTQMLKTHAPHCSVDRILEDPELRGEFLRLVLPAIGNRSEFEVLHGLNNLRKKSKLPRRSE